MEQEASADRWVATSAQHTAEHLRVTDRKSGTVNGVAKAWQEKRNVLGYFDGRPIKILAPDPKGQGVAMPVDYYS
ncbi:MAG TPA: hypothetical protein VF977_11085, partial [Candidatus Binatia bacterium]